MSLSIIGFRALYSQYLPGIRVDYIFIRPLLLYSLGSVGMENPRPHPPLTQYPIGANRNSQDQGGLS